MTGLLTRAVQETFEGQFDLSAHHRLLSRPQERCHEEDRSCEILVCWQRPCLEVAPERLADRRGVNRSTRGKRGGCLRLVYSW